MNKKREKRFTPGQLARRHRDMKIRATYESLPPGAYRLEELARMYGCNVSSVWYAIHGRKNDHQAEQKEG